MSMTRSAKRYKQRKDYLDSVRKKVGKCSFCGYDKYWNILSFHHLQDKKFSLSGPKLQAKSFKCINEEINKCILLCPNCHSELHYLERIEEIENEERK